MFDLLLLVMEASIERKKAKDLARETGVSVKAIEEIQAVLAKIDAGFKKSKLDYVVVDEIGLSPAERKRIEKFVYFSQRLKTAVMYRNGVLKWLQKEKVLDRPEFIVGVGGGAMPSREKRGAFAGASDMERKIRGSIMPEPEREFVGGPYGAATHQPPHPSKWRYPTPWGKKESVEHEERGKATSRLEAIFGEGRTRARDR